MHAFEHAGFYGIQILKRDAQPWRTVQGIEFRSVTVEAFKGKQGECFERNQAVIYRGPFKEVLDDDNHRMERGRRYAVCDKTYNLYKKAPYREFFEFVDPLADIPLAEAKPFDCSRTALRHPKETKGQDYDATTEATASAAMAAVAADLQMNRFAQKLAEHSIFASPRAPGNSSSQRRQALQSDLHALPCERRTKAQGDHDAPDHRSDSSIGWQRPTSRLSILPVARRR